MISTTTKLPLYSTISYEPLWIPDPDSSEISTIHRQDYKGHFHSTKIPGANSLIASSKKPKVSAYLSTLPLSPPINHFDCNSGNLWLDKSFHSKNVKWRRGPALGFSDETFDRVTNYQSFFTKKQPDPQINYQPKHIPLQTREKFNSVSTYNSDYLTSRACVDDIRCNLQKPLASDILTWSRPPQYGTSRHEHNMRMYEKRQHNLPPLDNETTYRSQFQYSSQLVSLPTNRNINKLANRESDQQSRNSQPFNARSIYQDEYTSKLKELNKDSKVMLNSSMGSLKREIEAGAENEQLSYRECNRNMFYKVDNE